MREGETDFVGQMFDALGEHTVSIEDAATRFLDPLAQVCDPERKRCIIGEEFLEVQKRIIQERHLADGAWILGQGTIYPDTIESGGSRDSAVIKTHHNRVPGVQELLSANKIVEPLSSFYKDEVREIGHELGLPAELLERHPFPGPGLAIRCLCAPANAPLEPTGDGFVVPIRSVGVQGDSRTYAPVLATDGIDQEQATELINRLHGINRVISRVAGCAPLSQMQVFESRLSRERLSRLRRADAVVRRVSHESGFDKLVWQFPVVVIPLGTTDRPDSVVLRPIDSVDGMTAQSVPMDAAILQRMVAELLLVDGVCGVFYDLTHKPPGTIEWE
jgi:GMP synthase (glutamine-hydrolysing)